MKSKNFNIVFPTGETYTPEEFFDKFNGDQLPSLLDLGFTKEELSPILSTTAVAIKASAITTQVFSMAVPHFEAIDKLADGKLIDILEATSAYTALLVGLNYLGCIRFID